jgi:16S rRNA (adenine1518-N6/adenine1519-N6)-dimethyltransferase
LSDSDNKNERLSLGKETRQTLRASGLKAKKSLGQHFLVDRRILGKIISAGDVGEEDVVIEVGPGLGVLTAELVRLARQVVAVEIDSNLAVGLKERITADNLSIVGRDILDVAPSELLPRGETRYKVVANLPYYITSPVLRHFLEADLPPDVMVVMVQREVARTITAAPGKMSLLSVGVQLYGHAEIVAAVPARSFHPVPKVESAVVRITRYPQQIVAPGQRDSFFSVVRAGFGSPRKQLINTLSHGLGVEKEKIFDNLNTAGIEPTRRAESLSIEEWRCLWQVFRLENGGRPDED